VTVPEAPVDKDHGAMLAQDQIRPARQCPGMKAEAEPCAVQGASHPHLRHGVSPADRRHHARPGGSINDVWHDRASVSAMAVRDHRAWMVWEGRRAAGRIGHVYCLGFGRADELTRLRKYARLLFMRMLPPRIYQGTQSRAERVLFSKFAKQDILKNAACLHSVGLPEHVRHSGEIDFLIISRHGILVIEVKGGAISCRDGTWGWDGKSGLRETSVRSPYVQVSEASSALFKKLNVLLGEDLMQRVVVGHGLIFPDVHQFDYTSVETPEASSITIDDATVRNRGLDGALQDLYQHWQHKFPGKGLLADSEVAQLINAVRADYEVAESLAVRAHSIIQELDAFTEQQYARLDILAFLNRAIVTGGAGTGKTFIATEMARRFASAGKSVLFITYSASLASFLAQKLKDARGVTVQSFNTYLETRVQGWRRLPGYRADLDATDPWYRTTLLNAAKASAVPAPADVLVIDEGQDFLTMDCLDVLTQALRGGLESGTWRFLHDATRQASPFAGSDPEALPYLESLVDNAQTLTALTLTQNCRNSENIVNFVRRTCEANIGAPLVTGEHALAIKRETCATSDDFVNELVKRLENLQQGGVPLENITILSPKRLSDSSVAKLPSNWKRRVTECKPGAPWEIPLPPLTFVSIDDIRGLENQHVILTDLESVDATPFDRSRFYIAITRARVSLTILQSPEARQRIAELMEQSFITSK